MKIKHGELKPAVHAGKVGSVLRFLNDRGGSLKDKAFFVAGLIYVISPVDILPELVMGPLGLTDDLWVVLALWRMSRGAEKAYKDAEPVDRLVSR